MDNEQREHGLGRLEALDHRDNNYLMATALEEVPLVLPRYRYWRPYKVLDQGPHPHCVGFAWRSWLDAGPIMTYNSGPAAQNIYHEAQKVDEWPGESYGGTSVRAGAKILLSLGHIGPEKPIQYLWAFDEPTMRQWVLGVGPVVVGINWYEGFDKLGPYYVASTTGRVLGGHAFLIYGYSQDHEMYRAQNSWGSRWGDKGRFWIPYNIMSRLLHEHGEACTAVERRLV